MKIKMKMIFLENFHVVLYFNKKLFTKILTFIYNIETFLYLINQNLKFLFIIEI